MAWESYRKWQLEDPLTRADISVADGFIAGAAVSLQVRPDKIWISDILGRRPSQAGAVAGNADDDLSGPRRELMDRLRETRAQLAAGQDSYVPTLDVGEDGDFDLAGWASAFLEVTAPDLDIWLYHLADRHECGLLGVLATHALGPMGDAGRAFVEASTSRGMLESLRTRSWQFIPRLLQTLYQRKIALADLGG